MTAKKISQHKHKQWTYKITHTHPLNPKGPVSNSPLKQIKSIVLGKRSDYIYHPNVHMTPGEWPWQHSLRYCVLWSTTKHRGTAFFFK